MIILLFNLKKKRDLMNSVLKIAAIGLLALTTSVAAEKRPTEHAGLTVDNRDAFELAAQIPVMDGYQVRVRQVTMEPGGVVAAHDHKTRPGGFFVVRGSKVVEYRSDGSSAVIAPGTSVLETIDVDHWVINEGTEAHLFVFDIVPVE
jgi:quercetin dioxygenase-like cupin family protein